MNRGECEIKNTYVVAISFMILAIISLTIHASNSKVGANGFLEEPFFPSTDKLCIVP